MTTTFSIQSQFSHSLLDKAVEIYLKNSICLKGYLAGYTPGAFFLRSPEPPQLQMIHETAVSTVGPGKEWQSF